MIIGNIIILTIPESTTGTNIIVFICIIYLKIQYDICKRYCYRLYQNLSKHSITISKHSITIKGFGHTLNGLWGEDTAGVEAGNPAGSTQCSQEDGS